MEVIELHGGKFDGLSFTPKDLEDLQEIRQLLGDDYVERANTLIKRNQELRGALEEISGQEDYSWATIHASGTLARVDKIN